MTPMGYTGEARSWDTRIELPSATIPDCRLQIGGRCLLALEYVQYPGDYRGNLTGTVTLDAIVTREGIVRDVRLVGQPLVPPALRDRAAESAIANLKTWRVERGVADTPLRITYAYELDPSVPEPGQVDLEFELPRRITQKFRPLQRDRRQ